MALIQSGKVSAGDLIKVIGMEGEAGGDAGLSRDFVIRVVQDEGGPHPSSPGEFA
jgi:hypothetical protein